MVARRPRAPGLLHRAPSLQRRRRRAQYERRRRHHLIPLLPVLSGTSAFVLERRTKLRIEVFCEATIPIDPGEEALDYPRLGRVAKSIWSGSFRADVDDHAGSSQKITDRVARVERSQHDPPLNAPASLWANNFASDVGTRLAPACWLREFRSVSIAPLRRRL